MRALVRNDVFSGDYALVRIPSANRRNGSGFSSQKRLPSEEETRHKWSESHQLFGKNRRASTNHTYTVIEFVGVGGDAVSIFVDEGPVHR